MSSLYTNEGAVYLLSQMKTEHQLQTIIDSITVAVKTHGHTSDTLSVEIANILSIFEHLKDYENESMK